MDDETTSQLRSTALAFAIQRARDDETSEQTVERAEIFFAFLAKSELVPELESLETEQP